MRYENLDVREAVMEVELATQFIETICSECVIRVDVGDPDYPYVGVRLLRGHPPAGGLRYRFREAWSVFMGRGADWWEFYSQDEINRFVAALEKAKPTIPLPPEVAYTTGGLSGVVSGLSETTVTQS